MQVAKPEDEWRSMNVNQSELEVKTVLACGQSFRWKTNEPKESEPQEWTGVFAHRVWILKQTDNRLYYKVHQKSSQILCDEDAEFLLKNYFQLEVPLAQLYKEWSMSDPKFASLPLEYCQGIRILNQDPIETIFAFICSANNNISRISQMVEKLCTFYGETIVTLNGKTYYDFPLVENLESETVEGKLRAEAFGYRSGYISRSARIIVANGGVNWMTKLKTIGYSEARKELQTLVGVGRKVADCVCLMGLGYNEAIPVDTHIFKLGKEYLPTLKPTKTVTDKIYTEISDHFRRIHGEYAGWAQSVLFSSKLRTFEGWFKTEATEEKKFSNKKMSNKRCKKMA